MRKYFLFILLLFITGCSTAVSSNKSEQIITGQIKLVENFQYSAPWDNELLTNYYNQRPTLNKDIGFIKGGIIPHHLLAGKYIAGFFAALQKQNPSVIVLIGPNHFDRGQTNIISSALDWQTPFGILKTDTDLVNKLVEAKVLSLDEKTMAEEHSIYGPVALLKEALPKTEFLPIILKNELSSSTLDNLVNKLQEILPADAVVISSIDFSHYQHQGVADFHDELSEGVIGNFNYSRLNELEIDSVPSLYVMLKMMEKNGTQKIATAWHDNSADLASNADLTTSYYLPFFVAGEPSQEKVASFLFFGDLMLDRNVKKAIEKNSPDYLLKNLAGAENRFFRGVDIFHANLEGPFANSRRATTKEIAFRFDPVLIPTLKKYNFNIFDVANNHSLDMSVAGLNESKVNLKNANIDFYGDGYGIGKDAYLIKEVGGLKIGFVGFNDTYYPLDKLKIKAKIEEVKKQSDLVVVNIHWGQEYLFLKSNARQKDLAHLMIDAGADLIVGHHPHVIEEMEIYKNKPIFYSLGNFIFDQYFSPETQMGLAVGVVYKKDLKNSLSVYVMPLQGVNSQVSLMNQNNNFEFMKKFVDSSRLNNYNFSNSNNNLEFNF